MSKELTTSDPYLWLEDIEGTEPLRWVQERNERTVSKLEQNPRFEGFRAKVEAMLTAQDRIPSGEFDGEYVYNFWEDDRNVRGVLRRVSLDEYRSDSPCWETVLDIDALAKAENENWVFQGAQNLPREHDRTLITLSRGGTDASVVREFDLERKAFVKDGFILEEAKSTLSWLDREHLLVATDFGADCLTDSGYPREIKLWRRGTRLFSAKTMFEGTSDDVQAFPFVIQREDRKEVFYCRNVDFFSTEYYWVSAANEHELLPLPPHTSIACLVGSEILVIPKEDWVVGDGSTIRSGCVASFDLDSFARTGKIDVKLFFQPREGVSVVGVVATRDYVYLSFLDHVNSRLLAFKKSSGIWRQVDIALPTDGVIGIVSASNYHNTVFVQYESYLTPTTVYLIEDPCSSPQLIKKLPSRFDAGPFEEQQRFVQSSDGTSIPYSIVSRRDSPCDGNTPTLMFGYGGFQIPLVPNYLGPLVTQWLEMGGAFVVANIRGGGEYGPPWHQAALKEKRQVSFDDFIAVAEDLIESGVTSPQRLGIQGGSNGGLLIGAMLTQRPDLFSAVVCQVPLLDMMRYHQLLAGPSWTAEYGDPDVEEEKEYLLKYSPYHNLSRSRDYPTCFFTTSTKDDRVHPGHARKMVARMEEFGFSPYYFENTDGGHGGSADALQQAKISGMLLVYLVQQLMDD